MTKMFAWGAVLAALAMGTPPSSADAQSRESGGYSSRGLIGGGTARNLGSRSAVTRPPPFTRPPPLIRPSPVSPPGSPMTAPGSGMSGYGGSPLDAAPPGTRATIVKPR